MTFQCGREISFLMESALERFRFIYLIFSSVSVQFNLGCLTSACYGGTRANEKNY